MTIRITKTIAHEVGHHVIAQKKFVLRKRPSDEVESEEEFATRYAREVIVRMQHRWYYQLGSRLLKLAAAINYQRGAHAWNRGRFDHAARYFDMSIQVELNYGNANHWFWKAREKAHETKASLNVTKFK
jgi:hypothetical protein